MKSKSAHIATVQLLAILFFLIIGVRANAVETFVAKTNWAEKTITNVIEIWMPSNRFVNVFRTNRVEQFRTNVVALYATNWVNRTATNHLVVDAYKTNFVNLYKTNWKSLTATNLVSVDALRTNFLTAYTTNRKTLNLTNWETVIVMKTNWVRQPVTNVVEIDLASKGSGSAQKEAGTEAATAGNTGLMIEASRTARPAANNHVEVELRLKGETSYQTVKWRVEKEDGTILSFGTESQFKRELPVGRYKVEAKVQRQASSSVQTVRGTLEVNLQDAVIQQQKLFGKN